MVHALARSRLWWSRAKKVVSWSWILQSARFYITRAHSFEWNRDRAKNFPPRPRWFGVGRSWKDECDVMRRDAIVHKIDVTRNPSHSSASVFDWFPAIQFGNKALQRKKTKRPKQLVGALTATMEYPRHRAYRHMYSSEWCWNSYQDLKSYRACNHHSGILYTLEHCDSVLAVVRIQTPGRKIWNRSVRWGSRKLGLVQFSKIGFKCWFLLKKQRIVERPT